MSLDAVVIEQELQGKTFQESGLKDIALLRKLWPFIRPHRLPLLLSLLLLPLMTAAEMAQPFILKAAIDGPVRAGNWPGLLSMCGLFLGTLVLYYALRYLQLTVSQVTGERIIYELRTQLYAHLQSLSPRFYQRHPIGKIVTRITSDVENLSEMFSSGGIAILSDIGVILGAVIGMFIMEPRLALGTSLMLPVLVITMEYFRRRSRRAYDEIRVNVAGMNAFLQENISGMEVVQLYRREAKNFQDFKQLNRENLKINLKAVLSDSSLSATVEFLTYITIIIVLWLGGQALTQHTMTFGLLVAFFQFVQMMFNPIEDLGEKYTIIQAGLASIDKIMALFQEQPELPVSRDERMLSSQRPLKLRGEILFEDVTFGYLPGQPILKGLSFEIKPAEKIALVGPSGAGKTTLIKLLSRFYDVNQGTIRLDGRDIREYDLKALRQNIVVIQQDDFLFSRSIRENITLDNQPMAEKSPEYERLMHALQQANAMSLVQKLPGGIDAPLKERGKNLSYGEKQLLLFARALYHDPAILILDEATSAIDPHTESLVQQAMERLMTHRTVLVIAHRLSTIRKADRIFVLDQGTLAESGSHEALLQQKGLYAKFTQYQQAMEENPELERFA